MPLKGEGLESIQYLIWGGINTSKTLKSIDNNKTKILNLEVKPKTQKKSIGWRSRFLLKNMTAINDILTRILQGSLN